MKSNRWLIIILLLAAVLRFWGLGSESLWLDEGFTLQKITLPLPEFVQHFGEETQAILYYFVEKIWCGIAGTSEWVMRFPSVIYGLAAVFGIFLLGRELFSTTVGLYGALFLAINPFAIFYSQEARPYMLFLAAAIFSVYFLVRVVHNGTRGEQAGYVMTTTAALYTHPLAPLLFGVYAVVWFIFRREKTGGNMNLGRFLALSALALLLYVPQLILLSQVIAAKTRGVSPASWIPVPAIDAFIVTVRQYFMHPFLYRAVVAVMIISFAVMVLRKRRLPAALWVPASFIVFCMIVPWIISRALTPLYVDRYTIPALAGFLLFLAWTLSVMPLRLRVTVTALFIILSGLALHGYYAGMDKDPWREAAAEVRALVRPGDLIIVSASYTVTAFQYYYEPPADIICIAPRSHEETPAAVDTTARIVLVSAYDHHSNDFRGELLTRVAAGRIVTAQKIVAEHTRRNPYAYWISPIRTTVFERRRGS